MTLTMWRFSRAQENIDMNPGMENIHVAAGDLSGVTQLMLSWLIFMDIVHLTEDAYRLVGDEGY